MGATVFRGGISGRMIEAAVSALEKGELIIYPTDTLYGIGCDLKNRRALEKLNRLKQRQRRKPFSFICESLSGVSEYAQVSDTAFRIIRHLLPGPYTFILPMKSSAPRKMMNAEHAVGIRVPDHPVPLEIVRNFGGPIVTTSVNVATEEPLCAIGDLAPEFLSAVAVIIDHGPLENIPSTVVDFTGGVPRLARRGKGLEDLKPFIDFIEEE